MSDRLTRTFAEVLNVPAEGLSDETSPANTPEWNSLATVNLALAVQAEFGVRLSMKEIMSMTSIGIAKSVLSSKGVVEFAVPRTD